MAMLSFDIRSLAHTAVVVDDVLGPDDPVWEDGDIMPAEPLHVKGRLSPAGEGRYYWHGSLTGSVNLECSRCLGPSSATVSDDTHIIFAESGAGDVVDDPDVFMLGDRQNELDLRPAIREQWLLNVPAYALCRDDCKGLCATCGAELNAGDCGCTAAQKDVRSDA